MRALVRLGSLLCLLIASSSSAVTMEWTPIGNPGNACDNQPTDGCFGDVDYSYYIGTYEVTNAQYAEFLNAKAALDLLELYSTNMGNVSLYDGGITRSGIPGIYTYSAIAGRENRPVNSVSFYDVLRFANWMNNGQASGDTETGAYTLLGGTPTPSNGSTVTRNPGASIFLTNEDEWYKAAYYSPSGVYYDYPAGSNTATTCAAPNATANQANCGNAVGGLSIKGGYPGSASPYGTFDQGGNLWEWNEAIETRDIYGHSDCTSAGAGCRVYRGGGAYTPSSYLSAGFRDRQLPSDENDYTTGFRLAMIPEPGTGLLVIAGLLGLAGWRRVRA